MSNSMCSTYDTAPPVPAVVSDTTPTLPEWEATQRRTGRVPSLHEAVPSEFAAECEAIDDAREAAHMALREANARGLTGADAEAMRAAMTDIDARCAALRRTYFPDCHRLYVVIGMALTVSRGGQSREIVWERTKH